MVWEQSGRGVGVSLEGCKKDTCLPTPPHPQPDNEMYRKEVVLRSRKIGRFLRGW